MEGDAAGVDGVDDAGFGLGDEESEDFESDDFESDDFDSEDFDSEDFDSDFESDDFEPPRSDDFCDARESLR